MKTSALVCAAIILMMMSCSSPTDLNTPRNKFFEDTTGTAPTRVKATAVSLKIIRPGNAINEYDTSEYDSQWEKAEIHTTNDGLILWIRGVCNRPSTWPAGLIPLSLTRLTLHMDSLVVNGAGMLIRADLPTGNGTEIVLAGMDTLDPDFVYAPTDDPTNNITIDLVSHDKSKRVIEVPFSLLEYPLGRSTTIKGILSITY